MLAILLLLALSSLCALVPLANQVPLVATQFCPLVAVPKDPDVVLVNVSVIGFSAAASIPNAFAVTPASVPNNGDIYYANFVWLASTV